MTNARSNSNDFRIVKFVLSIRLAKLRKKSDMALKRAADNIDKNVVTLQRRIETIEAVCVIVPLLFMILRNSGTWHVYRTELDEHGNYMGKREEVGTTELDEFADNAGRGLEMGKYYRSTTKRRGRPSIFRPSPPRSPPSTPPKCAPAPCR